MAYFNKPIYNHLIGTASITTAWTVVPVSATTAATTDIQALEVFSGTGTILELGAGATTGSATSLKYYVFPGGTVERIALLFNEGRRLYVRSVDVNATAGAVAFNFLG